MRWRLLTFGEDVISFGVLEGGPLLGSSSLIPFFLDGLGRLRLMTRARRFAPIVLLICTGSHILRWSEDP
jgi:hypothetical protein